jgi:hypothetical protein
MKRNHEPNCILSLSAESRGGEYRYPGVVGENLPDGRQAPNNGSAGNTGRPIRAEKMIDAGIKNKIYELHGITADDSYVKKYT